MNLNLTFSAIVLQLLFATIQLTSQAIPVEIVKISNGNFQMLRGGEPYWIEGAGTGNPERFAELAKRGGNSVRTWGADEFSGELLDSAYNHGLSVMLGLWVGRESDGFDYNNEAAVSSQLQKFIQIVQLYKDHPALLAWGIGNEVNIGYSNLKVWDAIDGISRMIHELDGQHPTLTVTAGISTSLANAIADRAADLDFLGVNSYGGIASVSSTIQNSVWEKPYVMTEWGINGAWETAKSSWGAPIEPNSTKKADTFKTRYQSFINPNKGKCLGSYAFLWNEKFESTLTWFGLFVGEETTPMIDALQNVWTDTFANNRAPLITKVIFSGLGEQNSYLLHHAQNNKVEIFATDPENDNLSYEYIIRPETGAVGLVPIPGSTYEGIQGIIDFSGENTAILSFNSSEDLTNYRLYILVRDGNGHIATATLPLRTELTDLKEEYEFLPEQDAYVGDGDNTTNQFGKTDPSQLKVKFSPDHGENYQTYLLFDLSQAPPVFNSVKLEMYGNCAEAVQIEAWGFGGHYWNEDNITWNNRIIPGSGSLVACQIESDQPQWYTWELTDFIEKQFTQKNRDVTLVLRGNTNQAGQTVHFESKETENNIPKLVFYTGTNSTDQNASIQSFMVYPNPAYEEIHIKLPENITGESTFYLFTFQGEKLKQFKSKETSFSISLKDLPGNLFMLSVVNENCHYHSSVKLVTIP